MRKLIPVAIVGSFCLTISCAHKNKAPDITEALPAKIPIAHINPQVTPTYETIENTSNYTCDVNGDPRIITINKTGTKCTVDYTKSGNTTEVAWGESTPQICTNVLDNIKTNIESAGFTCTSGTNTDT